MEDGLADAGPSLLFLNTSFVFRYNVLEYHDSQEIQSLAKERWIMDDLTTRERDILYFLLMIPGLGRKRIRAVYETYGSYTAAMEDWEDLVQLLKIKDAAIPPSAKKSPMEAVKQLAYERETRKVRFLACTDPGYPERLRQIPDPPLALFYRGEPSLLLDEKTIGVVGSRKPSPYGRAVCATLTKELAHAGFTIISGLAYGIDGEAHETAIKNGGRTIGVMGCGIDQIYPAGHRHLYHKMESMNLLISEYPPGTRATPGLFPERNRIISGLSAGVLIVEAAERSGSLITADCALEQGKDVYAVPGPIFSELSAGPHNLLKQGAKLVTKVSDILEEWEHILSPFGADNNIEGTRILSMSKEEMSVYQRLTEEGVHTDELLLAVPVSERGMLHQTLLILEAKGHIASLPGGYYARR